MTKGNMSPDKIRIKGHKNLVGRAGYKSKKN